MLEDGPRPLVGELRLAPRDLRDADRAMLEVAVDVVGPENLGLAAERPTAQPIHLPEPVLGHGEPQPEVQIRGGRGVDVGNAPPIAKDLDARADRCS